MLSLDLMKVLRQAPKFDDSKSDNKRVNLDRYYIPTC